jgi:hypothetical protein
MRRPLTERVDVCSLILEPAPLRPDRCGTRVKGPQPRGRIVQGYICATCGTQFTPSPAEPAACPVCEDERQYIGAGGQKWLTLDRLRETHRCEVRELEPGLFGIGLTPSFAIGQRALVVCTDAGNVLWDCIPLIDETALDAVKALGGLAAIAISHPHFYSSMVEWSTAFGGVPIYLHAADRAWVMRPDPAIVSWQGDSREILPGVTLVRCGGHFGGSTVLHWDRGALLTADTIAVAADRRHVSFMRSFPNLVPLSAAAVTAIVDTVRPYRYDRIYGGWWDRVIGRGAAEAVDRSARRYLTAIGAAPDRG